MLKSDYHQVGISKQQYYKLMDPLQRSLVLEVLPLRIGRISKQESRDHSLASFELRERTRRCLQADTGGGKTLLSATIQAFLSSVFI